MHAKLISLNSSYRRVVLRNEPQYPTKLRWGMLHTAAEGETATRDREGGRGAGEGDLGVGEEAGEGGGGGRAGRSVPWVPRPKLIPE